MQSSRKLTTSPEAMEKRVTETCLELRMCKWRALPLAVRLEALEKFRSGEEQEELWTSRGFGTTS